MRRVLYILIILILFCNNILVYSFDLSQIMSTNLVANYDIDTTVDKMDTVVFGSYMQNDENTKEPIEWIVLERDNEKALLLSKYVLDCKCYHEYDEIITWKQSTLREWLNESFYSIAFDINEQSKILSIELTNNNNMYGAIGGQNTIDKVFCLSTEEVKKYFYQKSMNKTNNRLAAKCTKYAMNIDNLGKKLLVSDRQRYGEGWAYFWLRSPGRENIEASAVGGYGTLYEDGYWIGEKSLGIRPALWVSILQ